jgi:hypothetical protein
MLLASVSTDVAKVWLDRRGWDRASRLLERFGLTAPEGWRRNAAALGLLVANGILDWRMREDTPFRSFAKEILRDTPSELISRFWSARPSPDSSLFQKRAAHPLFALDKKDQQVLLARIGSVPRDEQERLRTLLAGLQETDLAALAAMTPGEFSTMLDIMTTPVPKTPKVKPLTERLDNFLSRAALVLVPSLR